MFRMDEIEQPTVDLIDRLIRAHDTKRTKKLKNYYDGEHDILNRSFKDTTKPNNRIVTNFCKYITDVSVGNFIGNPVSYTSSDEAFMERLQEIYNYNDEQQINAKLAKAASIYSVAYEILFTEYDEETGELTIRFDELDQDEQNIILVYDRSIDKRLQMAIRYFDYEDFVKNKKVTEVFVYTRDTIYHYEKVDNRWTLLEEIEHFFREVPVNPYWNKAPNGKGDFESIITLNDAYNLLQSDDINESNYTNDAYLVIKNMQAESEDLAQMKENRALQVGEDGEVSWLIKDINDSWKENLKTRIQKDIHRISATPDMTDENFAGNASGVSIRYKLLPFENSRAAKEREFKKGLQRRVELIANMLNNQGNNFDWRDINMQFKANLPVNEAEEVEGVTKLVGTGLVSKDTLRNKLSFIEDSALEAEKVEQENAEYVDLDRVGDDIGEGIQETEQPIREPIDA